MFDVFNEIEGAPNLLLSAQRHYITRYNSTVAESSAALNMKVGDKLCILVFSDLLVICKRKRSLLGKNDRKGTDGRTPSRVNSGRKEKKEELVYRGLINAVEIMKILDIKETFECQRCFSYCVKRNGSMSFFFETILFYTILIVQSYIGFTCYFSGESVNTSSST